MSLSLGEPEVSSNSRSGGEVSKKYILALEANVPTATKGGTFSINVMLPPTPGAPPVKPPAEGEDGPLSIVDLTVDQITRWTGEVVPNEKGIVLRERIFVPPGNGDVTATIRVTVTGLPKVVLNAQLMAQLPPKQEMRPRIDGATPEPFPPGSMMDPKEYNGRQNWLASRCVVAEKSGMERVMFLH